MANDILNDAARLVINSFDTSAGPIPDDIFKVEALREGSLGLEYTDSTSFHGSGALRLSYHVVQVETWGGYNAINHVSNRSFACSEPGAISFWYNVENKSSLEGRVQLRLILADSSDTPGTPGETSAFERYYSFNDILESEPGWNQVVVDLKGSDDQNDPFWRPGWSGITGNRVLNPSTIRGYSFEMSINGVTDGMGHSSRGVFLLDGLECVGTNTLLSAFDFKSWEHALAQNAWWQDVYASENTWSFVNETSSGSLASNVSSALVARYSFSSSQTSHDFLRAAYLLPGVAYYNLSSVEEIVLRMKVENAYSPPSGEFRFVLLDASNCISSCDDAPGSYLKSFAWHHDLANATKEWRHVSLSLDENDDNSPLLSTGFNKDVVKGFRYEVIANDSQAVAAGEMFLEGLRAPGYAEFWSTDEQDDFVFESRVSYNLWMQSNVRYKSFVTRKELCARLCIKQADCVYFTFNGVVTGRNCALTDAVLGDSIVPLRSYMGTLSVHSTSAHTSGWVPSRRPNACGSKGVCHCTETVVNCSDSSIKILPLLDLEAQNQAKVLSLHGTQVSSFTQKMLNSTWNLVELHLGSSVTFLEQLVLDLLPQLTTLTSNAPLGDIILDLTQPFLDVHCDPREAAFGSTKVWVCHMLEVTSGQFCKYERYVFYSEWELGQPIVGQHRAGDELFGWVATSPSRCCEFCEMTRDCSYFVLDRRASESEPTCYLRNNGAGRSEELDEFDSDGGAGYISGYTPAQRAKDGEVRIDVDIESVTLSVVNQHSLEYSLSISGSVDCGAVWIIPQAIGVNDGVIPPISFDPAMLVFYNGTSHASRRINITSTIPEIGGEYSFTLRHEVRGCDVAWSFLTANYLQLLRVLPDACDTGEVLSYVTGACNPCPVGTYQNRSGDTMCTKCIAGKVSSMRASNCTECAPGRYSEDSSTLECFSCAPGKFAGKSGSALCTDCAIGTYAARNGSKACTRCPGNQTTLTYYQERSQWSIDGAATHVSACGCDIGTQSLHGTCVRCGVGLDCIGNGTVFVLPGYASDGFGSVFKCHRDLKRCPGGEIGTCAYLRLSTSVACSHCESGHVPSTDGACRPCNSGDSLLVVISIAIGVVGLCALYAFVDWKHVYHSSPSLIMLGVTVTLAMGFPQSFAVIARISISWPPKLMWFFEAVQEFTVNIDLFGPECVADVSDYSKYLARMILVMLGLLILCLAHVFWTGLRYKCDFGDRWHILFSSSGTLFMMFFISMCAMITIPFQCIEHPNKKLTLRVYPGVLCWDSKQHSEMIAVGIVATILPIGFWSLSMWVVLRLASRMMNGDTVFLRTWAFLYCRFQPESYWFAPLFLLRSAAISGGTLFETPFSQILWLQLVFQMSMLATLRLQPWRIWQANYIDVSMFLCMIVVVNLAAFFVEETHVSVLANLTIGFIVLTALFVLCAAILTVYKKIQSVRKQYQFFLCHHKEGAGASARLLKQTLAKGIMKRQKIFLDCDDLADLNKLFDIVCFETAVFILCNTHDIFMRPWCVGEIASAYETGVQTIVAFFPGSALPKQDFIDGFGLYVPEITMLTAHGLSLAMIQDALRALVKQECIYLPPYFDQSGIDNACSDVLKKSGFLHHRIKTNHKPKGRVTLAVETVILADTTNFEGMATALVLYNVIVRLVSDKLLHVLQYGESLTNDMHDIILICTNGVFQNPDIVRVLMQGALCRSSLLPIVADLNFRFPNASTLSNSEQVSAISRVSTVLSNKSPDDYEVTPTDVQAVIGTICNVIGICFQLGGGNSSETTLKTKANEIAARLTSPSRCILNIMGNSGRFSGSAAQSMRCNSQSTDKTITLNSNSSTGNYSSKYPYLGLSVNSSPESSVCVRSPSRSTSSPMRVASGAGPERNPMWSSTRSIWSSTKTSEDESPKVPFSPKGLFEDYSMRELTEQETASNMPCVEASFTSFMELERLPEAEEASYTLSRMSFDSQPSKISL